MFDGAACERYSETCFRACSPVSQPRKCCGTATAFVISISLPCALAFRPISRILADFSLQLRSRVAYTNVSTLATAFIVLIQRLSTRPRDRTLISLFECVHVGDPLLGDTDHSGVMSVIDHVYYFLYSAFVVILPSGCWSNTVSNDSVLAPPLHATPFRNPTLRSAFEP